MTQGAVEVPLNATANDTPLPEGTTELPQGTLAEDATFELHIRDRVIINSIVTFLKGFRDLYICEDTFFLLHPNLCLMMEVPTEAAHLQKNEHGDPPIFVSMLDMAANIR